MSRPIIFFALSLLVIPFLNLSAQEGSHELIEAHKQAVNPGSLGNAQILKWVGTESTGVDQPGIPFVFLQAQEGKWQTTRYFSGTTVEETFTGANGWVATLQGNQLSTVSFEFETPGPIVRMSQWGSLLARAEQYGYEPEYLGQKREGGSMVHEFRMNGKNYDGFMLYLDANTNMVTKIRDLKIIKGRQESVEILFSDYRQVEDAMLPFRIETLQQGETKSITQFETLEINPEIPESTWSRPRSDGERARQEDKGKG